MGAPGKERTVLKDISQFSPRELSVVEFADDQIQDFWAGSLLHDVNRDVSIWEHRLNRSDFREISHLNRYEMLLVIGMLPEYLASYSQSRRPTMMIAEPAPVDLKSLEGNLGELTGDPGLISQASLQNRVVLDGFFEKYIVAIRARFLNRLRIVNERESTLSSRDQYYPDKARRPKSQLDKIR